MIILSRKSLAERIEIVRFFILNNFDYVKTSQKYRITYNTLHNWVLRYEDGGEDALSSPIIKKNEDLFEKEIKRLKNIKKELMKENIRLKKELEALTMLFTSSYKVE